MTYPCQQRQAGFAEAIGKKLGRPKGSRDKEGILDPHRGQIKEYLDSGLSLRHVRSIINPPPERPIELSYPGILEDLIERPGLLVVDDGEVVCLFNCADF